MMTKYTMLLVSVLFYLSGCGNFLQSDPDLPAPYVSALKVDCMDVTNGTPNCTTPTIFLEGASGTYITRFTHEPTVMPSLPITLHLRVRNSGDVEFSAIVRIGYVTNEYPCVSDQCSSAETINSQIILQPGEIAIFDVPVQNPKSGGLAAASISWPRPNDFLNAGMGDMFFRVQ